MGMLIANCLRCNANNITFDATANVLVSVSYDWKRNFEVFSVCRNCKKPTIFKASQKNYEDGNLFKTRKVFEENSFSLNNVIEVEGYVSVSDNSLTQPPEFVPQEICKMFHEGSVCLKNQCWNAAATMFRGCIDLATRPLLPPEGVVGIKRRERYNLGARLEWLFANDKLHAGFKDLSECIREDGNDGAHEGTLGKDDAEDLFDFTYALLERLYTEPAKLEQAKARRVIRRTEAV